SSSTTCGWSSVTARVVRDVADAAGRVPLVVAGAVGTRVVAPEPAVPVGVAARAGGGGGVAGERLALVHGGVEGLVVEPGSEAPAVVPVRSAEVLAEQPPLVRAEAVEPAAPVLVAELELAVLVEVDGLPVVHLVLVDAVGGGAEGGVVGDDGERPAGPARVLRAPHRPASVAAVVPGGRVGFVVVAADAGA